MTASDFEDAPRRIVFQTFIIRTKDRAVIQRGANVGFLRNPLARAGQPNRIGEGLVRMGDALGVDPCAVGLVDSEDGGGDRRDREPAALTQARFPALLVPGRDEVEHRLTVLRDESVEKDQGFDRSADFLRDAGDHEAGVRVPDQNDVLEPFPTEQIHDVVDVGFQPHLTAEQVRPLPQTGERRCEGAMSARGEPLANAPPAPAAVPCAVDEDERCHLPSDAERANRTDPGRRAQDLERLLLDRLVDRQHHDRLPADLVSRYLHRRDVDVAFPRIVPTFPMTPGTSACWVISIAPSGIASISNPSASTIRGLPLTTVPVTVVFPPLICTEAAY